MSGFMSCGGSSDYVNITNQSVIDSVVGSIASAAYIVNTNGVIQQSLLNTSGGTPADLESWLLPAANSSLYTVRAHVNSGTSPTSGDSLDADLSLSSSRTWTQTKSTAGTLTCVLLITIKRASDGATMDTALATVTATRT